MEKSKLNIGLYLVFSFLFGIICGFPLTMTLVSMNCGNLQENNGLMYKIDCNISKSQILLDTTNWCLDRLKMCINDKYILENKIINISNKELGEK